MNKVIMIGRATDKPSLRTTQSGKSVATLGLAVNRRYDRETTDFFNIVVWGKLAENCAEYIDKGQQIAVSGELQIRTWVDKNDQKRLQPEIVAEDVEFLAKRAGSSNKAGKPDNGSFYDGLEEDEDTMVDGLFDDGELPF